MSQSTFCMNSGCKEVETDQLYKVTVPPRTRSWTPLGHGLVRDTMLAAISAAGFTVERERWALSDLSQKQTGERKGAVDRDVIQQDGNRCFGLIELGNVAASSLWTMAIGIQNSLDKSLALRRLLAASVFVCDNLVLSTGDADGVVTFRKHTSKINLADECLRTVESARTGFDSFARFIQSLQDARCSNDQFNEIVCRAIQLGIVPGTGASDMLRAWYDKTATRPDLNERLGTGFYDDRNGWTAHGLWTDGVGKRINPTAPGNRLIDAQAQYNDIVRAVLLPSLN